MTTMLNTNHTQSLQAAQHHSQSRFQDVPTCSPLGHKEIFATTARKSTSTSYLTYRGIDSARIAMARSSTSGLQSIIYARYNKPTTSVLSLTPSGSAKT